MAAPARTKTQREADLERIAIMRLEGVPVRTIAAELRLSPATICRDIGTVIDRWKAQSVAAIDEYIAVELAKVEHLEATYWAAWNRSCRDRQRNKAGRKDAPDGTTDTVEKINERRDGNPAFLAGVERCIERRCKLLGLDAPTKLAPTMPDGKPLYRPQPMTPDEVVSTYAEAIQRAVAAAHDG